jgi:hypothetical protein
MTSFPKKRMTTRAMNVHRAERQEGIYALVNDLHDANIGTLWIESQQIGMEDYWLRVVIDRSEMGSDWIESILAVAENHGAKLSLRRDFGRDESRLALHIPRD